MGTYIGYWFVKRSKDIEMLELNHNVSFGTWKFFTFISFAMLLIQLFGGMILSWITDNRFIKYDVFISICQCIVLFYI